MDEVKSREVIREIKVFDECTWFAQAILEDSGIVSVSLGGKNSLTIFYDAAIEEDVEELLSLISEFCGVEIL